MQDIFLLLKNIEGGTGTFAMSLTKIKNISWKLLLLSPPKYRKIHKKNLYIFPNTYTTKEQYKISLSLFSQLLREILWIKKIYSKSQPNVILAVDSHAAIIAVLIKILYFWKKIYVVIVIQNNLNKVLKFRLDLFSRKLVKLILRFIFKYADTVVVVSKGLQKQLRQDFKVSSTVIYNSFPLSNTKNKPDQRAENFYKKHLVTICRLHPQKDPETIIRAFAQVKKTHPSAKLDIIGDGPLKPYLVSLTKKLSIKDVNFLSWIDNPQKIVGRYTIFLFASHLEGFPFALLEAMASGIPVISTDTPFGPSEIIQDNKFGILVPPQNPTKLAQAINNLFSSKKLYLHYCQQSLERAKDFSEKKMLEKYLKVLTSLN